MCKPKSVLHPRVMEKIQIQIQMMPQELACLAFLGGLLADYACCGSNTRTKASGFQFT